MRHCRVPKPAAAGGGVCEASEDLGFAVEHPALEEFLRATRDGPDKARKTGTILVFTEGGAWKCCLSDREGGLISFVSGKSFYDALACAEACLAGDEGDWRPSRTKGR